MKIIINILSCLVAIEFFYIMYLETVATTSQFAAKVFQLTTTDLSNEKLQLLLKNQGVYNGLLGIGLIYGVFLANNLLLPLLVYIVFVAGYGGYSSGDWSLTWKQSGLACLTLLVIVTSQII